jgi:hypothetical protein
MPNPDTTFEKHLRVGDLAKLWNVSRGTVVKLIQNDPDVVRISVGAKKAHVYCLIPESVARRIHARLQGRG